MPPFPQHELFEVWEEPNPAPHTFPWRAQLSGYVGQFPTEEKAKSYVAAVEKYRALYGSGERTLESRKDKVGTPSKKAPSTEPKRKSI